MGMNPTAVYGIHYIDVNITGVNIVFNGDLRIETVRSRRAPFKRLSGERRFEMTRKLFETDGSIATTILRLTLGVVFFAHGAQKMLGWFGGPGFTGTMSFFTGAMHIPAPLAFLAIAAEFFGGIGLILGFLTRIAVLGIAVNMLVAIATVHHAFGFFMNWAGTQKGEGFEFHLLVLAMAAFLLIRGAGGISVDRAIAASGSLSGTEPTLDRFNK
jgi:putative oxidoreductase